MARIDEKEFYKLLTTWFNEIMVPVLEDMEERITNKITNKFDNRFDKMEDRMGRQGKTLDNHDNRIEKLEITSGTH